MAYNWERRGLVIVDEQERIVADCRFKDPGSAFDSFKSNRGTSPEERERLARVLWAAPLMFKALEAVEEDENARIDLLTASKRHAKDEIAAAFEKLEKLSGKACALVKAALAAARGE